jgi:hypothetical protein
MILAIQRVAAFDFRELPDPPTKTTLINTDALSWIEPTDSDLYTRWFLNDGKTQLIVKAGIGEVQKMFGEIFIL